MLWCRVQPARVCIGDGIGVVVGVGVGVVVIVGVGVGVGVVVVVNVVVVPSFRLAAGPCFGRVVLVWVDYNPTTCCLPPSQRWPCTIVQSVPLAAGNQHIYRSATGNDKPLYGLEPHTPFTSKAATHAKKWSPGLLPPLGTSWREWTLTAVDLSISQTSFS